MWVFEGGVVLINILVLQFGPQTKIPGFAPAKEPNKTNTKILAYPNKKAG